MRKYIIMAINLILTSAIFCMVVYGGARMHSDDRKNEIGFQRESISVSLKYDADSKGIGFSFYNNSDSVQYVPKVFVELFKRNSFGGYDIVNDEISIRYKDGDFLDYTVVRIDVDMSRITADKCHAIQPESYLCVGTFPIEKILDVHDLKGETVEFQYDGRFGKSNVVEVEIM